VAAWIEAQSVEASAPTVKQRIAAVPAISSTGRRSGQIVPLNPATSVPGPAYRLSLCDHG
jgi:hypothetical protein